MSQTTTRYPTTFSDAEMDVPSEPNVTFSFVVDAPKAYVFDAWNLPREEGGAIVPVTQGTDSSWPGVANDMERIIYVGGVPVTQVVGNVQTPERGDWHFEWKAGAPYYRYPLPLRAVMTSVHGSASLSEGPGPDQTTVTIINRQRPGIALWLTRVLARAATPTLASAAPKRFAAQQFLGPQDDL
jgi:hypothetical protein